MIAWENQTFTIYPSVQSQSDTTLPAWAVQCLTYNIFYKYIYNSFNWPSNYLNLNSQDSFFETLRLNFTENVYPRAGVMCK